jgi:hypothetical protein
MIPDPKDPPAATSSQNCPWDGFWKKSEEVRMKKKILPLNIT